MPYSNLDWPIAAAMLQFQAVTPKGELVQDQGADEWAVSLQEVADAGFTHFDPTDSWLRIADLSEPRLEEFLKTVKQVGLSIPAVTTARRGALLIRITVEEYLALQSSSPGYGSTDWRHGGFVRLFYRL